MGMKRRSWLVRRLVAGALRRGAGLHSWVAPGRVDGDALVAAVDGGLERAAGLVFGLAARGKRLNRISTCSGRPRSRLSAMSASKNARAWRLGLLVQVFRAPQGLAQGEPRLLARGQAAVGVAQVGDDRAELTGAGPVPEIRAPGRWGSGTAPAGRCGPAPRASWPRRIWRTRPRPHGRPGECCARRLAFQSSHGSSELP